MIITGREVSHFILSFILHQLGSKADLLLLLITVVVEQAIKPSRSEVQSCMNATSPMLPCNPKSASKSIMERTNQAGPNRIRFYNREVSTEVIDAR